MIRDVFDRINRIDGKGRRQAEIEKRMEGFIRNYVNPVNPV